MWLSNKIHQDFEDHLIIYPSIIIVFSGVASQPRAHMQKNSMGPPKLYVLQVA